MVRFCGEFIALVWPRYVGVGLLALSFAACSTVETDQRKAGLYLQIGSNSIAAKNYPEAFFALQKAEELDPYDAKIQNALALAHLGLERYSDAEERFKRALKLNPKFTEARNNLGRLYFDLGRYPASIRELQTATEDLTYRDLHVAHYNLGLAYLSTRNPKSAVKSFLAALRLDPGHCSSRISLGEAYFEEKDFKRATEVLDLAAADCKATFDRGQYYSGLSYFYLGDRDRSRARLESLIQEFPQSAYLTRAQDLLQKMK